MSYQSKRELLLQIAPRYREASSRLKEVILDEFVAATGYVRKYAIRLLNHPADQQLTITRPRPPHYGPEVQHALHLAWTAANHICAKRLVPFLPITRGRPRRSNDQCYVEQKNGQIVRQVVGYDRFVGELAYRQLTELYRALRVYVNCFQPSMKLQTKQREGSKIHRTYDQAQTPMQRLLASGLLSQKRQEEFLHLTQALDPLRLLQQLEQLQKALWRHAIQPGTTSESQDAPSTLPFSAGRCAEEQVQACGLPPTPPSLLRQERRRKYQKSGRPHEQTQERTLRRGVQKIRARLLLTFDDQWGEEEINGRPQMPQLRAEVIAGVS